MTSKPRPPQGVRAQWPDLPERVRSAIEERLGSAVISAVSQPGGFSPGMAARIQTVAGDRVFIKAAGPELNPDTPTIYRREARIVESLPAAVPAPSLLWTLDEGDDGWVALAFEEVDGHAPAQPWVAEELDRVIDALVELSVALTPSPIQVHSARAVFARQICGWRFLKEEPPAGLDAWSIRHLDALAELEERAPEAVTGDTLLHLDVRADNLLLTPDRVVVVDWPWATIGVPWLDLVGFVPSVTLEGGPEPEDLLARHPAARAADPNAVTATVAALAGYFTRAATLPPPPGLPTVRAFQAAQGEVARRWVAQRTGWD